MCTKLVLVSTLQLNLNTEPERSLLTNSVVQVRNTGSFTGCSPLPPSQLANQHSIPPPGHPLFICLPYFFPATIPWLWKFIQSSDWSQCLQSCPAFQTTDHTLLSDFPKTWIWPCQHCFVYFNSFSVIFRLHSLETPSNVAPAISSASSLNILSRSTSVALPKFPLRFLSLQQQTRFKNNFPCGLVFYSSTFHLIIWI